MNAPTVRLVLCVDGTDNTPKDRTKVWRVHELIPDSCPDLHRARRSAFTKSGHGILSAAAGSTRSRTTEAVTDGTFAGQR